MESRLYPDRFGQAGIAIVVPTAHERDLVHSIYFGELVQGEFRDESRDRLIELISTMRERDEIDGMILGGTELSLILTAPEYGGVPILDTARVHVEAAVDWLLGEN